jgi:hypothetical protein
MKKITFLFFLYSISGFSQADSLVNPIDLPLSLNIISQEVPNLTGKLSLKFELRAFDKIILNHIIKVEINSNSLLSCSQIQPASVFCTQANKGQTIKKEISIFYGRNKIPFYYQKIKLLLVDAVTKRTVTTENAYLYFTPYNTVEIWNSDDFESQKRVWNTPDANPPQRMFIQKNKIPVSNLTNAELADENVPKSYISPEGLAYSIPIKEVIETDAEDSSSVSANGKGTLLRASNFRTWSGTIKGNIRALVGGINLPITGIEVVIMDKAPLQFPCLGIDDKLVTTYADNNGNFSVDVSFRNNDTREEYLPARGKEMHLNYT